MNKQLVFLNIGQRSMQANFLHGNVPTEGDTKELILDFGIFGSTMFPNQTRLLRGVFLLLQSDREHRTCMSMSDQHTAHRPIGTMQPNVNHSVCLCARGQNVESARDREKVIDNTLRLSANE